MTLEQAINHAKEVAEGKYIEGFLCYANSGDAGNDKKNDECVKCAREHEQLAEWLVELEQYRAIGTVESCREAIERQRAKKPIETERRDSGGWISCEDRLPPRPKNNPAFEGKRLEVYLVSVEGADYAFRAFWNGRFFADGWNRVNAVAWMPMPETYCSKPCESVERNDAGNE